MILLESLRDRFGKKSMSKQAAVEARKKKKKEKGSGKNWDKALFKPLNSTEAGRMNMDHQKRRVNLTWRRYFMNDEQDDWDQYLDSILLSYHTSKHASEWWTRWLGSIDVHRFHPSLLSHQQTCFNSVITLFNAWKKSHTTVLPVDFKVCKWKCTCLLTGTYM